jgi:hypothetical protein
MKTYEPFIAQFVKLRLLILDRSVTLHIISEFFVDSFEKIDIDLLMV